MVNYFHLSTAFSAASILFVAETALTLPLTATTKYHTVSNLDTDQLICYIQTADGRTLNLESLCKKQANDQTQIVISNVKYEGDRLIGNVINKTSKTARFVKVNYEVLDENGNVIERNSTYTEPLTLNPGQIAMFQVFRPETGNLRATDVEWNE